MTRAAIGRMALVVLLGAGSAGCGDDRSGGDDAAAAARPPSRLLELRPVVGSGPEPCAAEALVLHGECLDVGPVAVDADDVVDVRRASGSNGPELRVRFTPAGVRRLNEVAAGLVGHGRLVVVVDGRALMAPTVQSATFEDEIVVNGEFTDAEVEALVRAFTDDS